MTDKRAAVYARVSTAEQVEGTSLTTQVERCEHYLAAQGWTAAGSYVDEGVSGAKARRPALDRLMLAVRAGTVDTVVVAKLDRIGRSMRHLATLLGELDDRGVGLVSVSEAFDSSTASGRLQRNMLGSFAEFEREMIRDRMISGRDASVRAGKWPTKNAPYGYQVVGGDYLLRLEPSEAEALRVMIDLFVNHRSPTPNIARRLNALGFTPRRAPAWTARVVRAILRDSGHFSGTFTWGRESRGYKGVPITVAGPALLDAATHERLRARLAETAVSHTRRPDRYLLAGKILSPHGTPMYGYCSSTPLYRCRDFFRATAPPEGRSCDCKSVRVEPADAAVWAEVTALLSDPARLLAMAGLHLDRESNLFTSGGDDLAAMDRRIGRLEKAAGDNLSRLLGDGLDPAVAAHASRGLTDQLTAARTRRDQLVGWQAANQERHTRTARLLDLAEQARQTLPDADWDTKTRVLALLDVTVRVDGWDTCVTCHGSGWVPKWPEGQAPRTGKPPLEFGGLVCPECLRHRWVPKLVIEGTVPDADLRNDTANQADRIPFKVIGSTA